MAEIDDGVEVDDFLVLASRMGAAWPTRYLRPQRFVASLIGMRILVRSRGVRLEKGIPNARSIEEPMTQLDAAVPTIFQSSVAEEPSATAQRFNTWVMFLIGKARELPGLDASQRRLQFLSWWGQVGTALHDSVSEAVPPYVLDSIPTIMSEAVRQMELAKAQPVLNIPPAGPGSGPVGGGGGGGGGTPTAAAGKSPPSPGQSSPVRNVAMRAGGDASEALGIPRKFGEVAGALAESTGLGIPGGKALIDAAAESAIIAEEIERSGQGNGSGQVPMPGQDANPPGGLGVSPAPGLPPRR